MGLVKDKDVLKVTSEPVDEAAGDDEDNWDEFFRMEFIAND